MDLVLDVGQIFEAWWCGVKDSLRLDNCLLFFVTSKTIRLRTFHCLVLNGLIFLGSMLLAENVIVPLLRSIVASAEGGASVGDAVDMMFVGLYQVIILAFCRCPDETSSQTLCACVRSCCGSTLSTPSASS